MNILGFSFILFTFSCFVKSDSDSFVVCYYGTWAVYRQGNGRFATSDIDPNLCTHLIYAFAGLGSDSTIVSLDPYLDETKENFHEFNDLKSKNPQLKTLLAIGGYNEGSAKYSTMAANPALRQKFIKSAKEMVIKYDFDGLDVDWEYPAQRDSAIGAADKENFSILIKELKEEFGSNLLVTIAVAAASKSASLSYDIRTVSQYADFINLMTYDLHGSWESVTGHNAGLFRSESELSLPSGQELTVEAAVKYWLQEGAPPEKLVVGVPFYGRTFRLTSDNTGVGAPSSGGGSAGPYTQQEGYLGYSEICEKQKSEAWELHWDDKAIVPYAVIKNKKTWISYDDPQSLEAKVDFIKQNKLAGVMLWSIEMDDLHGLCGGESMPLLRSLNSALGKSEGSSSTTTTTSSPGSVSTTSTTPAPDFTITHDPDLTCTTTIAPDFTSTTTDAPNSSTTTTNPNSVCKTEGYAPNPQDCSSFYNCVRAADGSLIPQLTKCPANLKWDQKILVCNYPDQVSCTN